ncbi:MAG TPA: ABC transporter ATP-binding protein [Nitrososphaerales archaeon]|nr:ABC transporter ATP-binding protein [Nitrososphaerales archaeon]
MNVLESRDLQKTYSGRIKALDGVSISIGQGTVFGLLGPNGAGKTTFVKICATQLLPTAGSVSILGHDVVSEPRLVRKEIAVVPQEARPLSLQTPYEHVLTYLIARGVDIGEARKRSESILFKLNLQKYRNTICANLSGGLRQRVLIAMAMSTRAELLVLDEPTIGLDPLARVEVWNLVRDYIGEGKTILLTTHYMDEAEALSDRLAIVNRGKTVSIGTPAEIRAGLKATHVVIIKSNEDETTFQSYGRVLRAGNTLRVFVNQEIANELASVCLKKNLDVSVRGVSLEDAFISEVGEIESETD